MSPKIARRLSRANHHTPLRSSAWIYPSSCHWADGTTRRACPGNRWKSRDRPGRPRICPRWWGRAWLCPTCSCLQTPAKSTVLLTRISRRLCLFFVNGDWASPAHLAELSVSSTMAHGSTAASLTNELVDEDDEEPFSTSPSVWSAEFCFSHRIRASQLQVHSPGSWFAELRRVPFWLFTATPRTRQVGCDWQREPWTRQGPFIVDLIFTINVITWWVRYFITSIELSLSTQIRSFFLVFPSSFFLFRSSKLWNALRFPSTKFHSETKMFHSEQTMAMDLAVVILYFVISWKKTKRGNDQSNGRASFPSLGVTD